LFQDAFISDKYLKNNRFFSLLIPEVS
jgi:hypothetical protein